MSRSSKFLKKVLLVLRVLLSDRCVFLWAIFVGIFIIEFGLSTTIRLLYLRLLNFVDRSFVHPAWCVYAVSEVNNGWVNELLRKSWSDQIDLSFVLFSWFVAEFGYEDIGTSLHKKVNDALKGHNPCCWMPIFKLDMRDIQRSSNWRERPPDLLCERSSRDASGDDNWFRLIIDSKSSRSFNHFNDGIVTLNATTVATGVGCDVPTSLLSRKDF